MEEKDNSRIISNEQFLSLLTRVQQNNDKEALEILISFFEDDILQLSKFIKWPMEDTMQSLKLELIEILKQNKVEAIYENKT